MPRPVVVLIMTLLLPLSVVQSQAAASPQSQPSAEADASQIRAAAPNAPDQQTQEREENKPESLSELPPEHWLQQAQQALVPFTQSVLEGATRRGSALCQAGNRLGIAGYGRASEWTLAHYDELVIWMDALYDQSVLMAAGWVGEMKQQLDDEVANIQQQSKANPVTPSEQPASNLQPHRNQEIPAQPDTKSQPTQSQQNPS
ncbi:hypothetical protein [Ferrimonas gelatinilytica]|uniref:Secreted protein n=1 Tax=Ferrimonas gelatinilytica TaxID=1255257 RepID=A0ABP9SB73_9GAMM